MSKFRARAKALRCHAGAALLAFSCLAAPVTAQASDVNVWLPGSFMEAQVVAQLEDWFRRSELPGRSAWPVDAPTVQVTRVGTDTLRVVVNVQYEQVLHVGAFSLPTINRVRAGFDLQIACARADLQVDARNLSVTVASVVFQGGPLLEIEERIEAALNREFVGLNRSLAEATAGYGAPQQLKCLRVDIDPGAAVDVDFDLGCIETAQRHESCPRGRMGDGVDYRCIQREWTIVKTDCSPEVPENL